MSSTMTAATILTVTALPSKLVSSSTGLLKAAAIGAPKTLARPPSSSICAVRPYAGSAPGLNSRTTVKSAKKTGSCSSSGRHPEMGLALCSL